MNERRATAQPERAPEALRARWVRLRFGRPRKNSPTGVHTHRRPLDGTGRCQISPPTLLSPDHAVGAGLRRWQWLDRPPQALWVELRHAAFRVPMRGDSG